MTLSGPEVKQFTMEGIQKPMAEGQHKTAEAKVLAANAEPHKVTCPRSGDSRIYRGALK
jgi:hypothetical protein